MIITKKNFSKIISTVGLERCSLCDDLKKEIKDLNLRISQLEHPAKYKLNDKVKAMSNVGCLGYDEVKGIITKITTESNEWGFCWNYSIFDGNKNIIVPEHYIMEKIK